jgi:threonyl-tRNA synthetase
VQVAVLPVGSDHVEYGDSVYDQLRAEGFRVEMHASDEGVGARVRKAKMQKIPYVLVVGGEDAEARTVGVNKRGADKVERGVAVGDFIDRLRAEVDTHS